MLGSVFSAIFIKTRNLLPPIILHSLWNVYVLMCLVNGNGSF
jgi:membrane protease YdiL (CAAX protease family)